ncbi:MAG: hypothetical protein C4312_07980 [Thermoflexus sp.]
MKSIAAPGFLFTRLLAHHRELGLTCEQIMALLDLNREYHERQVAIQIEFARITEMLEIKWGRVDEKAIAEREQLLHRHAELFLEHERLFFEFARRGHELLTDEQIEKAEQIYHQEKDAFLKALLSSLNRAVAPHFQFVQTGQEWSDASIEALRSMARVPSFG